MKWKLLLGLWLFATPIVAQQFVDINRYKANYQLATQNGKQLIGLRSFVSEGNKYLLLLNPQNFTTEIVRASAYQLSTLSKANVEAIFKSSPYVKALELAQTNDLQLQNAGIDHSIPKEKGITLTIDLCPSHKPLDRVIFTALFTEFAKTQQPVPLAISVSGKWILKHTDDLNWLKSLVAEHKLAITWINHSYNHEVNSLPLSANFMLAKGTDLATEVLANEKLMLANGLVPSVFFRFPGLVSDSKIIVQLADYGLIPIGSDAWLAKGQLATNGSIVLIHGNGNEEIGVHDFIKLLQAKQVDVKNKQWLLFDLRKGLAKEFEK